MNINKYTEKAQEAVRTALSLAEEMNHPQLEPEHLLVALVEQREGIVPELLRKMGRDAASVEPEGTSRRPCRRWIRIPLHRRRARATRP